MLIGAVAGFSIGVEHRQPVAGRGRRRCWPAALLSLLHAVDDHPPSGPTRSCPGLALTFLGHGPGARARRGPVERRPGRAAAAADDPGPVRHPVPRPGLLHRPERRWSTSATCSCPSPGSGSTGPGRASTCARWARHPSAADAQGIGVYRTRYVYVFIGGLLAGLAGATITLAISPGWFGDQTVNGRGWIAVGLVIFAQWSPLRAAFGALLFGAIFRFILDIQGVPTILGVANPFQAGRSSTFFLEMLPYLMVILVVVIGSREAVRKRVGAPAALGRPYVRGERGA